MLNFVAFGQIVISSGGTTDETCPDACDGTFTANIVGGIPPYDYILLGDPNGIKTASNINSGTFTFTGLCSGTYLIIAQDDLGVNSLFPAFGTILPANAFDVISSVTNETCTGDNDGAVDVTINSTDIPYSFDWSTGATSEDVSGLTQGTYTLRITDGRDCFLDNTYNIISENAINVDFDIFGNACQGQSISANDNSTGNLTGASYTWDFGTDASPTNACLLYTSPSPRD